MEKIAFVRSVTIEQALEVSLIAPIKRLYLKQQLKVVTTDSFNNTVILQDLYVFFKSQIGKLNINVVGIPTPVISVTSLGMQ